MTTLNGSIFWPWNWAWYWQDVLTFSILIFIVLWALGKSALFLWGDVLTQWLLRKGKVKVAMRLRKHCQCSH